jgi:hypothetical protein
MKNLVETIRAEVEALGTGSILRELEGGARPGLCESFDMRVALTDREKVMNLLIKKRIEERT